MATPNSTAASSHAAPSSEPSVHAIVPTKRKRVGRACDYCRRKRLRCTTAQFPCSNCQLYNAECVYASESAPRSGSVAAQRSHLNPTSLHAPSCEPPELSMPSASQKSASDHGLSSEARSVSDSFLRPTIDIESALDDSTYVHAAQRNAPDDFMQFWNHPLDLSGSILFEGLYPSSFTAADGNRLIPTPTGATAPAATRTVPSISLQSHVGPSAKVSGIESLGVEGSPTIGSILPGLFVRKDFENSNFIGLNSTGATMAFCVREALQGNPDLSDALGLDFVTEAKTHVDEAGFLCGINRVQPHLPGKDFAEAAVSSFFENVQPTYPIVDESTFRASWEQLYTPTHPHLDYVETSQFYLVLAIGEISRTPQEQLILEADASSRKLYQQGWSMLQDCLAIPNVGTVQVLLLHVIFHMHCGKGGFAWMLCGMAIRISQAIGLHRRCPADFDFKEDEVRLRSRLWWVAYRLDGSLSFSQGRPTAVHSLSFDTELVPLGPEHRQPSPFATASVWDVYIWNSKLAQLQHRFCNVTSQSSSTATKLKELGAIDTALVSWCNDLPMECRPGEEMLVAEEIKRLVASLHLEYFSLLRAVHWASVTCAHANKDLVSSHPNPRIRGSEALCLSAARSLVRTLNDATYNTDSRLPAPFGLQIDHFMAALAVLYRNIFKSPQRMSTRADVEYLRAGLIHLEREMQHSDLAPVLQRVFRAMLTSAENIATRNHT